MRFVTLLILDLIQLTLLDSHTDLPIVLLPQIYLINCVHVHMCMRLHLCLYACILHGVYAYAYVHTCVNTYYFMHPCVCVLCVYLCVC